VLDKERWSNKVLDTAYLGFHEDIEVQALRLFELRVSSPEIRDPEKFGILFKLVLISRYECERS
jgi:hypothetical protein